MSTSLETCLDDLARRIDPDQEQRNQQQWRTFLDGNWPEPVFRPTPRTPAPPRVDWPDVHVNDAQTDVTQMLLQQFGMVSDMLSAGGGGRLAVRCNYGTGILPSLFGCELFPMPRDTCTLQAVRPLSDRDAIRAAAETAPASLHAALPEKVFRAAEAFAEAFQRHPNVGRWVELYHPDLQGPIDAVELICGCEMFLLVHDDPALLHRLLKTVTETYIALLSEWFRRTGPVGEYTAHWAYGIKGAVMLRNDSLMNLSPETYVEFVRPYDHRVFDAFGGKGAVHFCGRGDHYIQAMSEMTGLTAVDMTQPELNDVETILRHTVDKGIALLGVGRETVLPLVEAGRDLRGLVHCR